MFSERQQSAIAAIGRVLLFGVLLLALSIGGALALSALGVTLVGKARIAATAITLVAAVLVGVLMLRVFDGRSAGALGFAWTSRTGAEIGSGLMIGAGALALAALAMAISGNLLYGPDSGTAGAWAGVVAVDLGLFAVAAASEEAVFRGYPFQVLAQRFGAAAATVVMSIGFALAHGANPSVGAFALINIFLAGILLSLAYLRTRSLWFATAVHLGWNWAMASLFDLPVSGLAFFDTPLYEPVVGTPAWFTGSEFGPEGGLVGTIGFIAALLVVLTWKVVRPAPEMLALRPLVDTAVEGKA